MGKRVKSSPELSSRIKWTIVFRSVFALIIIISSLIYSISEHISFFSKPFIYFYNTAAVSLFFSIVYLVWLNNFKKYVLLAYCIATTDTMIVSILIYLTGGYDSVFTFLYLVVIIYTAMLLLGKASYFIAALASLSYGILIELEYYEYLNPYLGEFFLSATINESHIIYRIIIFTAASFAVAVLSGILAAQLKGARQDLKITQEHLKRVEKMSAVDELISGIAHEVKNPLASLSGSIQLLHEDTPPGSYEDKLMQIILRETDRLKQIVNDIRLFSKPNTNNATLTNLTKSIEEITELFSNDPELEGNIQIQTNLYPNIYLMIDPVHFHQILWNLLKNAAQAIEGPGKIIVELSQLRNKKICLTVEDSGTGIDKEKLQHIFDPFFTSKPDGTGLGLAIIHRLVDTYKGVIDCESTLGKGTVFTILLKNEPSTLKPIPKNNSSDTV